VFLIYSVLMGLAALALTPYWLIQSARHGKYLANLGERLGFSFSGLGGGAGTTAGAEKTAVAGSIGGAEKAAGLRTKRPALQAVWLHAVSVGEVLSSIALARALKAENPDRPLIVSTTTLTGQALAR
jgi:3-deoxy-D-manno-octulosonic-acid transferase